MNAPLSPIQGARQVSDKTLEDKASHALKGYVMDSIGDELIGVREHGFEKYGAQGLIASSVDFGWAGLSAELRAHHRGVITKSTKDGWLDLQCIKLSFTTLCRFNRRTENNYECKVC